MTANNLELFRKKKSNILNRSALNNDLNIREKKSSILNKSALNSDFNVKEKKSSILSLIKEAQEFNLLCKQISSQLCEKSERNFSFALIRNKILRKMNHVFVSQQKTIQVQLLELYHDCSNNDH